jgi:hypothetical protein
VLDSFSKLKTGENMYYSLGEIHSIARNKHNIDDSDIIVDIRGSNGKSWRVVFVRNDKNEKRLFAKERSYRYTSKPTNDFILCNEYAN